MNAQPEIIEAEPQADSAVIVRQETAPAKAAPELKVVTAAQAKIEAVANLTMAAYQRASTLQLTPEEIKALQADFPDEAFQPGAAGKENLIYIEHAHLRDRMNQVLGLGQWSIVPRNRWGEEFKTKSGIGQRVYVEAMLLIRGCFVAEAVGDMAYYPNNESQNYGDAVEGAKTAAFRRCAKELGVGLQAWKKEWCLGWWKRRNAPRQPQAAPKQQEAPTPKTEPAKPAPPKVATDQTRAWMIEQIGNGGRDAATQAMIDWAWIMPNETLEDLPLRFVPTSRDELHALMHEVQEVFEGRSSKKPYAPHDAAEESPKDEPKEAKDEPWRAFPVPFGKKSGVALGDLPKNSLFGFWANFKVETEYNGRAKKPETIVKDQQFREALDQAGIHYKFTKKDE